MKENLLPEAFYKIIEEKDFDKNNTKDCVKLSLLDTKSGFMHLSFGSQVEGTVKKFFSGVKGVLVLEIDIDVLKNNGSELKIEANKIGGDKYPHVYGSQKIPLAAVKKVLHF